MPTRRNAKPQQVRPSTYQAPWGTTANRTEYITSLGWCLPEVMSSDLAEILRYEGLLDRFNQVVKLCASRKFTTDQLFSKLKDTFPNYYPIQTINDEVFKQICIDVPEIRSSWNYGVLDDSDKTDLLKNRAFDLAIQTNDIGTIEVYNKMYDKENSSIQELEEFDNRATDTFVFNLTRGSDNE